MKIKRQDFNATSNDGDDESDDAIPLGYPSYSMGPMEILLVVLLFLLWFYALRRIYIVWSNVLNFSAIQSDGMGNSSGWDAFISWALEHFRHLRSNNPASEDNGDLPRATVVMVAKQDDSSTSPTIQVMKGIEEPQNETEIPLLDTPVTSRRDHRGVVTSDV